MTKQDKNILNDAADALVSEITKTPGYLSKDGIPAADIECYAQVPRVSKSNVLKIVPTPDKSVRVPRKTAIPENIKAAREHGWEYVDGIFENRQVPGESLTFCINPFPGDAYSQWTIPANVPVSVPRWLAKHLNSMKWVSFAYKTRTPGEVRAPGSFMEAFTADVVQHRGSFMPLNQY